MTSECRGLPWSITEFHWATTGRNQGGIAMLAAYFDESGTHDNSLVVSIAGLVGHMRDWHRLEAPWKRNLKTSRIEVFHASARPDGMSDGLWGSLKNGLADAIHDQELTVIGTSLSRRDWDLCATQGFRDVYHNNPYHFCFAVTMQQINRWSNMHAGGEPVALVFAEQKEYETAAKETYELYRHSDEYDKLGTFTWGKPQCLIQLQAADLVANETYHNVKSRVRHGEGNYAVSPVVSRLRKPNPSQIFFDCDGFMNGSKRIGV